MKGFGSFGIGWAFEVGLSDDFDSFGLVFDNFLFIC